MALGCWSAKEKIFEAKEHDEAVVGRRQSTYNKSVVVIVCRIHVEHEKVCNALYVGFASGGVFNAVIS